MVKFKCCDQTARVAIGNSIEFFCLNSMLGFVKCLKQDISIIGYNLKLSHCYLVIIMEGVFLH